MTLEMMIEILRIIFSVIAGLLAFLVTIHIFEFAQRRGRMKENLRKQRNAMVADLIARMAQAERSMSHDAFGARKALIRASFEFGKREGGNHMDTENDA